MSSTGQEAETASETAQRASTTAPHLSVIIPAYNEETRLAKSLPVIISYLSSRPTSWEVIVVDDGSRDATSRVAEQIGRDLPVRILRNSPNRGKGYSIRRGMLEARGDYRLFSDADLSTPMEELDKFWPKIESGSGVVFGSRDMPGSKLARPQPPAREAMGKLFNLFVRMLVLPGVHDTQCGFKLFTRAAAESVFPQQKLHGFAFDVEVLVLARRNGFKIQEVPVVWVDSPGSKVSLLRGGQAFWDLVALRFRRRK